MITNNLQELEFPLFELFTQLRQSGFSIGIDEYLTLLRALEAGFGTDLAHLCKTLWAKSPKEEGYIDKHFELIFPQLIPKVPATSPQQLILNPAETIPMPLQPPLPFEEISTTLTFTPELAFEIEDGIQVPKAVRQAKRDVDDSIDDFFIPKDDEYFSITRRQMKQSWRYLRRPIREGPPVELDIEATVNDVGRQGMLLKPHLVARRINCAELLLLIDHDGSMVPFHTLSRQLTETAERGGRLGKANVYYFHNCPAEYLYRDPAHLKAERIEEVLDRLHPRRAGVLIFSDAGAARSRFSLERAEMTKMFIEQLKQNVHYIAWLNPMPSSRWLATTAGEVMQFIPMFELNRQGLDSAIRVLRGCSTPHKPIEANLPPRGFRRPLEFFSKRFGEPHLYLAQHAAFPLALTPDLLYQLRAKFQYDIGENELNIPWIAVVDILLSNFCNEAGHELYEIDVNVRNELLHDLKANPKFGMKRIEQLSNFLLSYIQRQVDSHDPDTQDFIEAQQWTALAYAKPDEIARQLALALHSSLKQNDKTEQLRMASLMETFAEPLQGFAPLLIYARGLAHFIYGDIESAKALSTLAVTDQIKSLLGISFPAIQPTPTTPIPAATTSPLPQPPDDDDPPGRNILPNPTDELALPQSDPIPRKIFRNFSPYVKCICPSCFEEIFFGECKIVSGITGEVLQEPSKGPLARIKVKPLNSPKYTLELAHRACPKCAYLLPPNVEDVPSLTLAVIGDTFSGKSHYIAALIHQIKADWMGNIDGFVRFTCLTPEVEGTYMRDYFEPLFTNKQAIAPTQPATKMTADPLIYKLIVSPSPKHPPKTVNLIIYDTSGEDFTRPDRLVQVARFIFNTGGFVFVADPVKIPHIFTKLPHFLRAGLQSALKPSEEHRPADILNTTISLWERYHKHPDGSSLNDIPIAVMVSKADLLKYLYPSNNYNYTFMTNPQYSSSLNLGDINRVDQEVKDLLNTYQQGDLLTTTNRFKRVKFFATSATGEPPDATGHFTKVEPCRCLDPLLWILYQCGVIKASD